MKKPRLIKNNWYYKLINYILESIRKDVGSFKGKFTSLFKVSTPKQTAHSREKKLRKPKKQKQTEENRENKSN